jgi:hypothetical protein
MKKLVKLTAHTLRGNALQPRWPDSDVLSVTRSSSILLLPF